MEVETRCSKCGYKKYVEAKLLNETACPDCSRRQKIQNVHEYMFPVIEDSSDQSSPCKELDISNMRQTEWFMRKGLGASNYKTSNIYCGDRHLFEFKVPHATIKDGSLTFTPTGELGRLQARVDFPRRGNRSGTGVMSALMQFCSVLDKDQNKIKCPSEWRGNIIIKIGELKMLVGVKTRVLRISPRLVVLL